MKINSVIEQKSKGTNLYLNLLGTFDKVSALNLIKIIHKEVVTRDLIFVNTNKLQHICSYK